MIWGRKYRKLGDDLRRAHKLKTGTQPGKGSERCGLRKGAGAKFSGLRDKKGALGDLVRD